MFNSGDNLSIRLKKYLRQLSLDRKNGSKVSAWASYYSQVAKLFLLRLKTVLGRKGSGKFNPEQVDVLFIHNVALMSRLNRKRGIFTRLKDAGLAYLEVDTKSAAEISSSDKFYGESAEDFCFKNFDMYAQYIVHRYRPKIVVTDCNGDLLSPFLKKHMNISGGYVVHLPHSVLTSESYKYGMIDYDYYLLYGVSSLKYLEALKNKFGQCQAVLSGSYLFDRGFCLACSDSASNVLLLGMGPAMEEDPNYRKYYDAVRDWISRNPEQSLDIRLHPRSDGIYWQEVSKKLDNVHIRPRKETFIDSCRNSYMCITPYTNAVVDAALLGRPSLLVGGGETEDYLKVEDFFGERVSEAKDIVKKITIFNHNREGYQKKAKDFAEYHVANGELSVDSISKVIIDLAYGAKPISQSVVGNH